MHGALHHCRARIYLDLRYLQINGPARQGKLAALLVTPPTKSLPGAFSMRAWQVTEEEEIDD
jgi:hypothetical protein